MLNSAVNYMALARGPAADYDEWAKRTGDEGWKWENVLPLMKEVCFLGIRVRIQADVHG